MFIDKKLKLTLSFLIVALSLLLSACGNQQASEAAQMPPAMPVTYIHPESKEVSEKKAYLGRFDVLDRVELRPRVSGYIDAIRFKDGQQVKKGQRLFDIDARPFQLELEQAEAELNASTSALALAEKEWQRAEELRELNAFSQEEFDQRIQALDAAKARLAQAKVAKKRAKLDLDYARVTSPISGRIGNRQVSIGNVVQSELTHLATIVATSPMYFNFELSEADALRFQSIAQGSQQALIVRTGSDSTAAFEADFDFLDVQADRSTGTVAARAKLNDTPDAVKPGMFGRIELALSELKPALLVPDTLIGSNQNIKTLMVVSPENMVAVKPVVIGDLVDGKRVVWSGITKDERIISKGIQQLRPGMPVSPMKEGEQGVSPAEDAPVNEEG